MKVRHKIRCGATPSSINRRILSVNTFVFPVPAEADTQAEASGLEASCWLFIDDAADSIVIHCPRTKTIPEHGTDAGIDWEGDSDQ